MKTHFRMVSRRHFIKTPLTKQFYGDWEFEIRDPNGYILVFSELYRLIAKANRQ